MNTKVYETQPPWGGALCPPSYACFWLLFPGMLLRVPHGVMEARHTETGGYSITPGSHLCRDGIGHVFHPSG